MQFVGISFFPESATVNNSKDCKPITRAEFKPITRAEFKPITRAEFKYNYTKNHRKQ